MTTPENSLLTYDQLIERDQLVEYSANSHTSYYLFSTLAKLELRLGLILLLKTGFKFFKPKYLFSFFKAKLLNNSLTAFR